MNYFLRIRPLTKVSWVQLAGGAGAFAVAVTILIGWHRELPALMRLAPHLPITSYSSALALGGAGAAVLALVGGLRRVGFWLALAPLTLGVLSLLEYLTGLPVGLNFVPAGLDDLGDYPGRMSIIGALSFALVGATLLLSARTESRATAFYVGVAGGLVSALGVVSLVGYLSGIPAASNWMRYGNMSPMVAFGVIPLGLALIADGWRMDAPAVGAPKWMPLLVALSGVTATLILWQALNAMERGHLDRIVTGKAAELREVIESQIGVRVAGLSRMARRWEYSGRPKRSDWEYQALLHYQDYPGYKALQWVDPSLHVRWLVPRAGNEPIPGMDSGFEKHRRAALLDAYTRRAVTTTPVVDLVTGGKGFRLHVPLFRNGGFDGFIVGVFRVDRLLNIVLAERTVEGYGVVVREDDQEIFRRADVDFAGSRYRREVPLQIVGTNWTLEVAPTPAVVDLVRSPLPTVVLIGGFLLSTVLAFVAYLAHTARLRNVRLQEEIRQREHQERVLRESELRFRSVTESANDAIVSADAQGNILTWNQGAARIFGYGADDMLGRPLTVLMPERFRDSHRQGMARLFSTGVSRVTGRTLELAGLRKDGSEFPLEISLATWRVDQETLCSGVMRDISERKQAERELRDRERQLATAEKIAQLGSWEWDVTANRVSWSDEMYRIYGIEPGSVAVNYEQFLARVHADDRARVRAAIEDAFRTHKPFAFTHRIELADGLVRVLQSHGEVVVNAAGEVIRMIGTGQDITEQLRLEQVAHEAQAVRKSEEHFRALADSAPVLIWMTDTDKGVTYLNRSWLEFTGRSLEQERGAGWSEGVHPDDLDRCLSTYREAFDARRELRMEYRLRRHDGEYRWLFDHGIPRYGATGEFLGYLGSCIDIHDRKQVEEDRARLLAAERSARAASEAARKHLAFLAEASAVLSQSLDYQATLANVARLCVPFLADWAAIDMVEERDGAQHLRRVKVVHSDPAKEQLAFELNRRYPPDPAQPIGAWHVLRTGAAERIETITDEALAGAARDAEHLRILRGLHIRSYIGVPLASRGRVFGVLTLAMAESGRNYSDADLVLARDLAQRCGIAVDKALLFHAAQTEIAERQRAEEALANETERLAVTLYSIGDGVITTDTDGKVVLLNHVAEELTGWMQDQAAGQPVDKVFNIVNEKTREVCESPVARVLASGEIVGLANHTSLIAKNGRERAIADSGAPIRDKRGRIIGVVLVFRDVTEQQRMEQELTKARNLEAIGLLAGGIAHDFNNILTAILGNIALAKMYGDSNEKINEVLSEAEQAFWRARALTQQLLTFAKGGAPIKRTASIRELLVDTASFVLRGSTVRYEFDIAEDLWPADFDAGQISQVINNLVLNSKQAMPEGGSVTLRARNMNLEAAQIPLRAGAYIKIEVADNGPGIHEKHLERIFDPYFTTKQQGSGLGLATAYSIIAKHEGSIEVQSRLDAGTTFTFYLPASPQAALAVAGNKVANMQFKGCGRVLVMDDEKPVRQVIGALLQSMGFEVEFAAEGGEVLQRYRAALAAKQAYELVIMDLTVPGGMGGKDCIRELRMLDPNVKAIVSSGYSNDPVMANYSQYGFRGMVVKPYQLEELTQTLRQVLGD